ncbi:MAG: acyl--CoA ligase [Ruminococcaceae bacterium]|nr:acyl--CoA ligase [Oscillospiraceae bacterium]MBR2315732.1 acyl--CoA ligase [Clostridia bacterium]
MLPEPKNYNCYEYLRYCTEIYDDVYMMQHFGVKYMRSEIFKDIEALAAYFQNVLGLKKGDVYTIFMPTTVQSIVAFYALNKIGVITSFVHPLMATEFLKEQIELVHSKGVMVLDLLAKDHIKTINDSGLPCLVCNSSDYSEGYKRFGCKIGEGLIKGIFPKYERATYYKEAVKTTSRVEGEKENADDVAAYLNGGGTTGKSKTIKLTNRAINELTQRVSDIDEIHDPGEEAEIIVLPMFHCFGLCIGIHMAMCNSARIIPMMQFDSKIFTRLMRENKVVGFGGIPLFFQKLMRDKNFDGPHLKNVRLMFCGGDDISDGFIDEYNAYFEKWGSTARLRQGYGLTEIASVCCTNTNTVYKRGSIGKALRGVEVQIWDDDHKQLPTGEIGEFAISGPTIMQGYYMEGEAEDYGLYTDENGKKWVLSGDLGYQDEEGFFFFSGRKKRLIIIAGYNVYPTDIEKVVGELPFIKECCAVQGWDNGRSMVRLYATAHSGKSEEEMKQIIRETCEGNFSKFYVPKDIIFMDSLPETPLMKVDFMKLTAADPEKARVERKINS